MQYAIYIGSAVGALAVYLMLPRAGRWLAVAGSLLGLAALAGVLTGIGIVVEPEARPGIYFYIFAAIAVAAAVRVITHARPVYSALYFILVVLSVASMFIVLESAFIAFATIIIYAGAILVTYVFVIMLATQPQSDQDAELTAEPCDRIAREPLAACGMGFVLIAVLTSVIAEAPGEIERVEATSDLATAVQLLPGRVVKLINRHKLIETGPISESAKFTLQGPAPDYRQLTIADGGTQTQLRLSQTLDDGRSLRKALTEQATNIDRVGINLFQSHTLGIELAGVVLLLSMAGAIVLARQRVFADPSPTPAEQANAA